MTTEWFVFVTILVWISPQWLFAQIGACIHRDGKKVTLHLAKKMLSSIVTKINLLWIWLFKFVWIQKCRSRASLTVKFFSWKGTENGLSCRQGKVFVSSSNAERTNESIFGKVGPRHCVGHFKNHKKKLQRNRSKVCKSRPDFVSTGFVFRGIGPCDQSNVKWDSAGSMVT